MPNLTRNGTNRLFRHYGNQQSLDMWHWSNWEWFEYVEGIPQEYFSAWTSEEKEWALEMYRSGAMESARTRHIEICRLLENERDVGRRRILLTEDRQLRDVPLPDK